MGEALNTFVEEAQGLKSNFDSVTVFSIGGWHISQYTLYMFIILALVLLAILIAARNLKPVPRHTGVATIDYLYNFVRDSIGRDVIEEGFEEHVPFLATLFFFILFANVIGLIPGAKAATGTISVTWALSLISFIYFNYWGFKKSGLLGYVKSICPSAVPGPMKPIIWFLETFSLILRLLTLAVRLYGNMLSGHMILAVFSLATTVFMQFTFFGMGGFATGLTGCVWFILLLFMYCLECLVAFLQAYVFTILSASYIGMAIHPH